MERCEEVVNKVSWLDM